MIQGDWAFPRIGGSIEQVSCFILSFFPVNDIIGCIILYVGDSVTDLHVRVKNVDGSLKKA